MTVTETFFDNLLLRITIIRSQIILQHRRPMAWFQLFIKTVTDYISDPKRLDESAKNAAKLHIKDTRERIMQALDKLLAK